MGESSSAKLDDSWRFVATDEGAVQGPKAARARNSLPPDIHSMVGTTRAGAPSEPAIFIGMQINP
jgi:hypothetical protein